MRNQIVTLKNESYTVIAVVIPISVVVTGGAYAVYKQLAARVVVESSYNIKQRRFSAAGRSQNGYEFVFLNEISTPFNALTLVSATT